MRRPSAILSLAVTAVLIAACQPDSADRGWGFPKIPDVPKFPSYTQWMADSEAFLQNLPLTTAVIPGSHDAGTFSITDDAAISPDLPLDSVPVDGDTLKDLREAIAQVGTLQPVNKYMAKWARAQGVTIKAQLEDGIRYFDLRPSFRRSEVHIDLPFGRSSSQTVNDILIAHSLYGDKIRPMIDQVADFVAAHPKEIIFLDLSHFSANKGMDHASLVSYLKTKLGSELIPRPEGATDKDPKANTLTFKQVWATGKQVVCFYQSDDVNDPLLWRHGIPSGTKWWPNKPTTDGVKAHLSNVLTVERPQLPAGSFFVLQTVLTGDAAMFGKSVTKMEAERKVEEAQGLVDKAKGIRDAAQTALDNKRGDIKRDQDRIDYLWDKIKSSYDVWNNPGRLKEIGEKEITVGVNKGMVAGLEAAVNNAKGPLATAEATVTDLKAKAAAFFDSPGNLKELADKGNPTMLSWLTHDWATQPLNIVILDWSRGTSFVAKVVDLNKAIAARPVPTP